MKRLLLLLALALLLPCALCPPAALAAPGHVDWLAGVVEADGYALSGATHSQLSLRAARADAYRSLLEVVQAVRLDGDQTVAELMAADGLVRRRVSGYVKGAEVIAEERFDDGSWHVALRAPLYGVRGLASIVPLPDNGFAAASDNVALPDSAATAAAPASAGVPQIVLAEIGDREFLNDAAGSSAVTVTLSAADGLALGCLYETADGRFATLDFGRGEFGCFLSPPYVAVENACTVHVNGQRLAGFRRLRFYVYESNEAKLPSPSPGLDGAALTFSQPGSPDIVVRLDRPLGPSANVCVLAAIDRVAADSPELLPQYAVTKLAQGYYDLGQIEVPLADG